MATSNPLTNSQSGDSQRLSGVLAFVLRSFEANLDKMLPAMVVNYDRDQNLATVQPLITWVDVNNESKQRHELEGINVLSIGGGGFHISFPLAKGDLGWIFAADRDLTQFKQTLQMARPNSGAFHSFADCLFIPDVYRKYTINGEDSGKMVIQSIDASTRISIGAGGIKLTAPSTVTVDAPLAVFTGDVQIEKGLIVAEDALVSGISVINHGHISSAPGSRTGGGMIE